MGFVRSGLLGQTDRSNILVDVRPSAILVIRCRLPPVCVTSAGSPEAWGTGTLNILSDHISPSKHSQLFAWKHTLRLTAQRYASADLAVEILSLWLSVRQMRVRQLNDRTVCSILMTPVVLWQYLWLVGNVHSNLKFWCLTRNEFKVFKTQDTNYAKAFFFWYPRVNCWNGLPASVRCVTFCIHVLFQAFV